MPAQDWPGSHHIRMLHTRPARTQNAWLCLSGFAIRCETMLSKILLVLFLFEVQIGFSVSFSPNSACTRSCGEDVGQVSASSSECLRCGWYCDQPSSSWFYTGNYNWLACGLSGNEELYCMRYSCYMSYTPLPPPPPPSPSPPPDNSYNSYDDEDGGGQQALRSLSSSSTFAWYAARGCR